MKYKLSEICEFISDKIDLETNVTIKNYISTENMLVNKQGVTVAEKLPSTKRVNSFKKNDVLISNIRPYFKKIWFSDKDGGCSADVLVIRAKEVVVPEFLYCILSTNKFFDFMTVTAKGTKMPRGDKQAIKDYIVDLPNIEEQNKIAEVIFLINKKINVNININDNLLKQGILLHKRYCIDLADDSFVQETVKSMSKDVITGKTPSTKKKEYYGENMPFITIPDMHGNTFVVSTERCLSDIGAATQPKKIVPEKSIAVSCIATPGLVSIVDVPSQTNQQINTIIPQKNEEYYFFLEIKSKSKLIVDLGSSGSTTHNLNKGNFEKIDIFAPPVEKRREFNKMITPIFEKIRCNQHEIISLTSTRDLLLSELLRGNITL